MQRSSNIPTKSIEIFLTHNLTGQIERLVSQPSVMPGDPIESKQLINFNRSKHAQDSYSTYKSFQQIVMPHALNKMGAFLGQLIASCKIEMSSQIQSS